MCACVQVPVLFQQCPGPEARTASGADADDDGGHSYSNASEAAAVVRLVEALARGGLGFEDIGVISPYNAQVRRACVQPAVGHHPYATSAATAATATSLGFASYTYEEAAGIDSVESLEVKPNLTRQHAKAQQESNLSRMY